MNQKAEVKRYGKRRVPKMHHDINTLRQAIRSQGTEAIQDAWDCVEEHIDYVYGELNRVNQK